MKEFNAVLVVAEKAAQVIDVIVPAVRKVLSIIGKYSCPHDTSSAFSSDYALLSFKLEAIK